MTKQLPAKLPKAITSLLGETGLLPISELQKLPTTKRVKEAGKGAKLELMGLLYMGLALEGLKEEMGHGSFMAALTRENVQQTYSERAKNVLNLFRRIKPSNSAALTSLSTTKLYTLARWETDEVDAFLEGDCIRGITFDDALTYTTRQMDEVIKQNADGMQALKNRCATLEAKKEKLEIEAKQRNNRYLTDGATLQHPEYVTEIRQESFACSEKAIIALDDLAQMFNQLQNRYDPNDVEALGNWKIAAAALYHSIASLTAQAEILLKNTHENLPKDVTGRPIAEYFFSDQQAVEAIRLRDLMTKRHIDLKQNRENTRAPRRGRPRKKVQP